MQKTKLLSNYEKAKLNLYYKTLQYAVVSTGNFLLHPNTPERSTISDSGELK